MRDLNDGFEPLAFSAGESQHQPGTAPPGPGPTPGTPGSAPGAALDAGPLADYSNPLSLGSTSAGDSDPWNRTGSADYGDAGWESL